MRQRYTNFIERLRERSLTEKRRILLMTTFLVTSIIGFLWLLILFTNLNRDNLDENERGFTDNRSATSSLSDFFASVGEMLSNLNEVSQDILKQVSSTTSTASLQNLEVDDTHSSASVDNLDEILNKSQIEMTASGTAEEEDLSITNSNTDEQNKNDRQQ